MSTIAEELTRMQNAKASLATSISAKGVAVPAATKIDGYASLVDQISQGGEHNIIEGEVSLMSMSISISVECDIPSVPLFFNVVLIEDYGTGSDSGTITSCLTTKTNGDNYFSYVRRNLAVGAANGDAYCVLTKTECSTRCYSSAQFPAGKYKYQIIY